MGLFILGLFIWSICKLIKLCMWIAEEIERMKPLSPEAQEWHDYVEKLYGDKPCKPLPY